MVETLVSQLIRDRRKDKGWRQSDLADKMEVARNTIIRWEKGANPPDEPQRKKLAKALGGQPADYEWQPYDYERHDHLARIKLEAAAYVRKLLSGEMG